MKAAYTLADSPCPNDTYIFGPPRKDVEPLITGVGPVESAAAVGSRARESSRRSFEASII